MVLIHIEKRRLNAFMWKQNTWRKVRIFLPIMLYDVRQRLCIFKFLWYFLFNQIVHPKSVDDLFLFKFVFYLKIIDAGTILLPALRIITPYFQWNISHLCLMNHLNCVCFWIKLMNSQCLNMCFLDWASKNSVHITINPYRFHQCLFHDEVSLRLEGVCFIFFNDIVWANWICYFVNFVHLFQILLKMSILDLMMCFSFISLIQLHEIIYCNEVFRAESPSFKMSLDMRAYIGGVDWVFIFLFFHFLN